MEHERRVHRQVRIPGLLPRFNTLQGLEVDLEELGTAARQIFLLARQYRSLLDGGEITTMTPAASPKMPPL
jgi:hypothetical protein